MPVTKSVKKALRQSLKKQKKNRSLKDRVKRILKDFLGKPDEGGLKKVYSVLDKAKKEGIYHKNKTARLKAAMAKRIVKKETKKPTEKKSGSKMPKSK